MNVWFSADPHFWHKNIIKYENRPFKDVEEMNEAIINNYNSVLQPDDLFFILGDFALASKEKIANLVNKLKVKPYLILGNHDGSKYRMASCGFYIQKHTSRRNDYLVFPEKSFSELDEPLILTHKPFSQFQTKPFDFYGWNLHGHIHGQDKPQIDIVKKTINVNVEYWNYYPVSIEQIKNIINHPETQYINYEEVE